MNIPRTEDLLPALDEQGRLVAVGASKGDMLTDSEWIDSSRGGGVDTPCWVCGNPKGSFLHYYSGEVFCVKCRDGLRGPGNFTRRLAPMLPDFQSAEIAQQIAAGLLTPGPVMVAVSPPEGRVVVPPVE